MLCHRTLVDLAVVELGDASTNSLETESRTTFSESSAWARTFGIACRLLSNNPFSMIRLSPLTSTTWPAFLSSLVMTS